jgi:hypothetical protein
MTDWITVSVDSDVAAIYCAASESERSKLDLLVDLRLRQVATQGQSLRDIMDEISRNSQQRGLMPEVLESILNE